MKCPACNRNHRRGKYGMLCSCGYSFTFDPKSELSIGDYFVFQKLAILSQSNTKFYTFNQAYCCLHRAIAKKKLETSILGGFLGIIVSVIGLGFLVPIFLGEFDFLLGLMNHIEYWILFNIILAIALMVYWGIYTWKRLPFYQAQLEHRLLTFLREFKESKDHPANMFVDSQIATFTENDPGNQEIERELIDYPPEGILICESHELAECLILNRFHFDSKLLIVSATKTPSVAFIAAVEYLKNHAELPVYLLHDVTLHSNSFIQELEADPTWSLAGHPMHDLGLTMDSLEKMKGYCWKMPTGTPLNRRKPQRNAIQENLDKGFIVPVDQMGPVKLMSCISYSVLNSITVAEAMLLVAKDKGALEGGYG